MVGAPELPAALARAAGEAPGSYALAAGLLGAAVTVVLAVVVLLRLTRVRLPGARGRRGRPP